MNKINTQSASFRGFYRDMDGYLMCEGMRINDI